MSDLRAGFVLRRGRWKSFDCLVSFRLLSLTLVKKFDSVSGTIPCSTLYMKQAALRSNLFRTVKQFSGRLEQRGHMKVREASTRFTIHGSRFNVKLAPGSRFTIQREASTRFTIHGSRFNVKLAPGSRFTIQREASTRFTIHDSNVKAYPIKGGNLEQVGKARKKLEQAETSWSSLEQPGTS